MDSNGDTLLARVDLPALASHPLFKTLQQFCLNQGTAKTYWLAYSGGLDSHVLLYLLVHLRRQFPLKLKAIYINHGLSANAHLWAQHCSQVCKNWQVDFTQQEIQVRSESGDSLEELARNKRYSIFSELLDAEDLLLTAHHEDDQAETLMLQLFRGAGPKGLAAMPVIKSLGNGFHARPLLQHSRAELKTFAIENNLEWIEDESNDNINFSRNFIRHEILPILKMRWPTVTTTLSRVAANCAEAQELLENVARQDLETVKGRRAGTLSVRGLVALESKRQKQVIRLWLNQQGCPIPDTAKLQQIIHTMLAARADKTPHLTWKGIELRRYRDDLFAMVCLAAPTADMLLSWNFQFPLILPDQNQLRAIPTIGSGLRANLQAVTVRYRQGGEVCRLPGRQCHHSLKKLFQTWEVLPWERDRIPLIFAGDKLIAVVGFFLDTEFMAQPGEAGVEIQILQAHEE